MERFREHINSLYTEILLASVNLNNTSLFKIYKIVENLINDFEKTRIEFKDTKINLSHKDKSDILKLGESACNLGFWLFEQNVDDFEKLDALYDIMKSFKDIMEFNHLNIID